jgi:hypothetical protein
MGKNTKSKEEGPDWKSLYIQIRNQELDWKHVRLRTTQYLSR